MEERNEAMTNGKEDKYKEQEGTETAEEHRDSPELDTAAAPTSKKEAPADAGDINEDMIPEPILSTYFKPDEQDGNAAESSNEEVADETALDLSRHDDTDQKGSGEEGQLTSIANAPGADEERIVFDAWDNKQVEGINKKAKATLDKAGLELGEYTLDTVFKGNYLTVLNPRSKDYKRFRKLWKHPELLIDPRRWRDWTGAAAARRFCLAEGTGVTNLSGSHWIEIYYAKDRAVMLALAEEANERQYSVRQLKRAIEDRKDEKANDPGKAIIKTLDQSLPLLEEPDLMDLCSDKDRVLRELSKAERQRIRALISKRKPGLDEWKRVMESLEGILSEIGEE